MVDVVGVALCEHLNRAVRQITDKARQPMTIGDVGRGEAKANALHPPDENYMFGSLVHFRLTIG